MITDRNMEPGISFAAEDKRTGGGDNCACIHIGLPGADARLLQAHLFPTHSEVYYLGRHANEDCLWRNRTVQQFVAELQRPGISRTELSSCRELANELITTASTSLQQLVFSWERLSTGTRDNRSAWPELLQSIFGNCKILVVLMHPVALIESAYFRMLTRQYVGANARCGRLADFETIEDWISRTNILQRNDGLLDYQETVASYAILFGNDAVNVFPAEAMEEQRDSYTRTLCRFIGIGADEDVTACEQFEGAKHRWTSAQVERLQNVQRNFWQALRFRFADRRMRRILLGMHKGDPAFAAPPARAAISDRHREIIQDRTREGNRWIAETWHVPLEEYGYPL